MTTKRKTLSFSQANLDILELLDSKHNASQYVCDAIRFYEKNKNISQSNNIDENYIKKLVDHRVDELLKDENIVLKKNNKEIKNIKDIGKSNLDAINNFKLP